VKALTAYKSGTPPVASVLLSTDMFTLIDEDAIVPFDNFAKTADDKLWTYNVLTTKPIGAEHAPLHFLSANLFSADIHAVYERLQMPVRMSHGVRGDFTDYRGKVIVEACPNWHTRDQRR
jgi:hypothetical protein